jgi:GNAT superfamily N-acetyltransferase
MYSPDNGIMQITYRFLDTQSDSEISQWLHLYSVCFEVEITKNFWDYFYLDNPFYKKTKPLIFVALADNRIVGSLSAVPSRLTEYRENIPFLYSSLLICKGMVHPDFRKKGIFSYLLKNAMETGKSEGYDIVLATSNNVYSYQSLLRSGFHDVAAMRWSRLFLSWDAAYSVYFEALHLPLAAKKIIISSFSCWYSRIVPCNYHSYQIVQGDASEFIEEIENFYASIHPCEGIFGCRTTQFMRSKFVRKDARIRCFAIRDRQKMLGYAIVHLNKNGKNAYIVDIVFSRNTKTLISELIGEINTFLKKNNFQTVWTYMVENDTILSNFFTLRHGFFYTIFRRGDIKKTRLLATPLKKTLAQASGLDKDLWNIQAIDTCLFLT